EAVGGGRAAGGAEGEVAGLVVGLVARVDGVGEPAGHDAARDELVGPVWVRARVVADGLRPAGGVGGADRLVRLLRSCSRLVGARPAEIPLAQLAPDPAAHPAVGLGRDVGRVGAHVGDEAGRAAGAEVDAL